MARSRPPLNKADRRRSMLSEPKRDRQPVTCIYLSLSERLQRGRDRRGSGHRQPSTGGIGAVFRPRVEGNRRGRCSFMDRIDDHLE